MLHWLYRTLVIVRCGDQILNVFLLRSFGTRFHGQHVLSCSYSSVWFCSVLFICITFSDWLIIQSFFFRIKHFLKSHLTKKPLQFFVVFHEHAWIFFKLIDCLLRESQTYFLCFKMFLLPQGKVMGVFLWCNGLAFPFSRWSSCFSGDKRPLWWTARHHSLFDSTRGQARQQLSSDSLLPTQRKAWGQSKLYWWRSPSSLFVCWLRTHLKVYKMLH